MALTADNTQSTKELEGKSEGFQNEAEEERTARTEERLRDTVHKEKVRHTLSWRSRKRQKENRAEAMSEEMHVC